MMVNHGVVQLCRASPGQALFRSRDSHFVPDNEMVQGNEKNMFYFQFFNAYFHLQIYLLCI